MTALTVSALAPDHADARPVRWRRMAWVTWRQHRVAFAGVLVFLGAVAAWLWLAGRHLHQVYASAVGCHPSGSDACANAVFNFNLIERAVGNHLLIGGYVLQPLPALVGAFLGAPVLARELESGTFRYAWTQGLSRWRWALGKVVLLAVAVTAAAGALSLLSSWYYAPYLHAANQALTLNEQSPLAPALFDLRGIDFALWTLLAFSFGVCAGMLIRRVVPAIVATLVAYAGLALLAGNVLLEHYLTPLVTSRPTTPGSAWVMGQWWTRHGSFAFANFPPDHLLRRICPPSAVGPIRKPGVDSVLQCVAQHGYTHWFRYQPASRFWTFQWIEGGWLLALSVLVVALTVWMVQRRAA